MTELRTTEMNDEITKIGLAVHTLAQAVQSLDKHYKDAKERVEKIDPQSEQTKKLFAELSKLSMSLEDFLK